MSRPAVYTTAIDGSNRVWLGSLGHVTGLVYSSKYSGGPYTADWQLDLPPFTSHPALTVGRRVGINVGATVVWTGQLLAPERGEPWVCSAVGSGSEAVNFRAYRTSGSNALNLDTVVDRAIGDGLSWVRPAALPTIPAGTVTNGSIGLDEALTQVADTTGNRWQVTPAPDGSVNTITMGPASTTVAYILFAGDVAGGRTLREFATALTVRYIDSGTNVETPLLVVNAAADAKYGRHEKDYDLTGLGAMTAANATSMGTARLTKAGPRAYWAGTFTVTRGALVNTAGVPVDLATVTAGVRIRALLTDPDRAGEPATTDAVEFVVGECSYDADADVLQLAPTESARHDLATLLTPPTRR